LNKQLNIGSGWLSNSQPQCILVQTNLSKNCFAVKFFGRLASSLSIASAFVYIRSAIVLFCWFAFNFDTMVPIVYPEFEFKIELRAGKEQIFDPLRKAWLVLTPEEWVRQNFIQYLLQTMQYPAAVVAVEKNMVINELRRRFDLLVFNNQQQPWMIVECKAPTVSLTEKVLEQALRYNQHLQAAFITITNGSQCFCFDLANRWLLDALPKYA
jgi:hypothetical protein